MIQKLRNFLHWVVQPLEVDNDKSGGREPDEPNVDVTITVEELTIEPDDE